MASHAACSLSCHHLDSTLRNSQNCASAAAAEDICEGFDHSEAPPTNLTDAARQLKLATKHDAQRKAALPFTKEGFDELCDEAGLQPPGDVTD